MGLDWTLAFRQPGHRLSEQRKMLRRGIGQQRVGSHNGKIERNTTKLMLELSGFEGNPHSLISKSVPAFGNQRTRFLTKYLIDFF